MNETKLGKPATAAPGEWLVRCRYLTKEGEERCVAYIGPVYEEILETVATDSRLYRVEGCTAVRVGKVMHKEAA